MDNGDINSNSVFSRLKKNYNEKPGVRAVIAIFLVALALMFGILIGLVFNHTPDNDTDKTKIAGYVEKYAEDQDYSNISESNSIATPGFDKLSFKANQLEQEVTLYNPEENTCYFKISIALEDGTVIWTSDLLEPGMSYSKIKLNQKLKAGIYKGAKLRYDCYSLKGLSKLNGASMGFTLEVK